MSCHAAPWSRPSHIAGPRVPTSARPRFALGSRNLWKNSWTIGAGVSNMFALPSRLFRYMASSGSGDGGFARSTSAGEAVAPLPLYSWPNKQVLLVDQSDKFVFKPMLYELLSGARLVLALGAEVKIDVVPGSAEYAPPFTTLEDALRVESKLKMLERKMFGRSSPTIEVAIVGLGYSGVELVATISERLKNTGTVKAINVQTTICPTAPRGNRDAALKVLESRNIQLFLGYFVSCIRNASTSDDSSSTVTYSEVDGAHRKLILDLQRAERDLKGQTLEADLVLWDSGFHISDSPSTAS